MVEGKPLPYGNSHYLRLLLRGIPIFFMKAVHLSAERLSKTWKHVKLWIWLVESKVDSDAYLLCQSEHVSKEF